MKIGLRAPVLRPAVFRVVRAGRAFFSVGDGGDLVTAHAETDVILTDRGGAFLT